jgi:hypothetical protein
MAKAMGSEMRGKSQSKPASGGLAIERQARLSWARME